MDAELDGTDAAGVAGIGDAVVAVVADLAGTVVAAVVALGDAPETLVTVGEAEPVGDAVAADGSASVAVTGAPVPVAEAVGDPIAAGSADACVAAARRSRPDIRRAKIWRVGHCLRDEWAGPLRRVVLTTVLPRARCRVVAQPRSSSSVSVQIDAVISIPLAGDSFGESSSRIQASGARRSVFIPRLTRLAHPRHACLRGRSRRPDRGQRKPTIAAQLAFYKRDVLDRTKFLDFRPPPLPRA